MRITAQPLVYEPDVVSARQRARQIGQLLGLEAHDQTRFATAVSEIARNAFRYAGGGEVEFRLERNGNAESLVVEVTDHGPGIANLDDVLNGRYTSGSGMGMGIVGARRLVDECEIRSQRGMGTRVMLRKRLPASRAGVGTAELQRIQQALATEFRATPLDELRAQHAEMLGMLDELGGRQQQLEQVNRELEDTNRGVVALYAELDERANRLRRADETKSRFLSNMSHEFRTPLNSIRALTGLLLNHVDGPLSEEQTKQVELIRKASSDLAQLVEDLLDLAKIESGKIDVQPAHFTVESLFGALRAMLRPLLLSESVALRFDPAPGLPTLYTDEAKVSQILRNFISNALKYTERGEVLVTASLIGNGRAVAFAVADTGIGIAPENHELIFEEFEQVKGALQRRVKGTGLGLPLCRRLAGLLGGTVSVASELGAGSRFTATLPIAIEEHVTTAPIVAAPAAPKEVAPASSASVPILIFSPASETHVFYRRMLGGTPYQPLAARSVHDAREALRVTAARTIVIDADPDSDELRRWLRDLRQDPERAQGAAVIAIAKPSRTEADPLIDAWLEKPVDRAALLAELARLTGRRILVVDDDPAIRYTMRKLLTPASLRVIDASNAQSGWEMACACRPDLIILDLELPDMRGEELLQRLKADPATMAIPVVIATAQDFTGLDLDTLGRQAYALLSKRELQERGLDVISRALGMPSPAPRMEEVD